MIEGNFEMNDIVERLRSGIVPQSCEICADDSAVWVTCGRGTCIAERDLMRDAADEIERLRQELADLKAVGHTSDVQPLGRLRKRGAM